MAIASRPSERGMLASVDARCTCARVAEVSVDCANHLEQPRIRREFARRTIADLHHFALHYLRLSRTVLRRGAIFGRDRLIESGAQGSLQPVDLRHRGGAQIDRMLADSGIELTEVPPRITPTLNVVFGEGEPESG